MSGDARLSHLFVTVSDLAAARSFWTDAIGLDVLMEEDGYVRVGREGGFSMGIERAGEAEHPAIEVVAEVADVDATYERLRAIGVACEGPPAQMPWGGRHIWLRDPDGRRISLYSASGEGRT